MNQSFITKELISDVRVVEWKMSNVCNYDCSFCSDQFKDGSKQFLDFDTYTKNIERLIKQDTNKKVWVRFTGGEPTLFRHLIELLKFVKDLGGYTSMISNGSRTIRWWEELADANALDWLSLSHHCEQGADVKHTIKVNNIMQATNTYSIIYVTTQANPVLFNQALADHREILTYGNAVSSLKAITDFSMVLQPYTEDQLKIIQQNLYIKSKLFEESFSKKIDHLKTVPWPFANVKMTYSDGTTKIAPPQEFVNHNETNFYGWECDAGKESLWIDTDKVHRSLCFQSGPMADVRDNTFSWADNSIICNKRQCNCSFDVQSPKRRIDKQSQ